MLAGVVIAFIIIGRDQVALLMLYLLAGVAAAQKSFVAGRQAITAGAAAVIAGPGAAAAW